MIKFIENLVFPIYYVYRKRRGFSASGAAFSSKMIAAVLIGLFLSLIADIVFLVFVTRNTYTQHKNIFENDLYVLVPVSTLLGYFLISGSGWEEEYERSENGNGAFGLTILVLVLLMAANMYAESNLHSVFK